MQELSGETGITLAYAGKSRVAALRLTLHRDHPRVCGEKPAVAVLFSKTMGSPPAYAGKSALRLTAKDPSGDHPRMCGEKSKIPSR